MEHIKKHLKRKAVEKYKTIVPCSDKKHLDECFTEDAEKVMFWFNVEGGEHHKSTKIMIHKKGDHVPVVQPDRMLVS